MENEEFDANLLQNGAQKHFFIEETITALPPQSI
jgi:hypothetical protein